jgi:hypothetical protein
MLYEIKHRYTGAVMFALECESLKLCVEAAVSAKANLRGADLYGANLRGADLRGADLSGADLIDAGQDRRGFRFWAWRNKDGTVYRAGCHEWADFAEALAWYGDGYPSTGDRHECIARLTLLRDEAARRWPVEVKQEAA